MPDSLLDWLVVSLPTLLSVAGVLVSINVPKSHHRKWWYSGLIVFGVGLSCLTYWQQARARASHETEVATLRASLARIETNTKVPPRIEVNVPPPSVVFQDRPSAQNKQPRAGNEGLKGLSNPQLRTETLKFASQMRKFEWELIQHAAAWETNIVPLNNKERTSDPRTRRVYADGITVYNNTMLDRAKALRSELSRRLGAVAPNSIDASMEAFEPLPTDVAYLDVERHPIIDAAAYLEQLAKRLPAQ